MICALLKRLPAILCITVPIVVLAYFVWLVRPLTPSGHTFQVESWQHGKYEFQIWQRKNDSWREPFTTALFVRTGSNQNWRAFSLGFKDYYAPRFSFQENGPRIAVFRNKEKLGEFNPETDEYLRFGQTRFIYEGVTTNPSLWWNLPATSPQR